MSILSYLKIYLINKHSRNYIKMIVFTNNTLTGIQITIEWYHDGGLVYQHPSNSGTLSGKLTGVPSLARYSDTRYQQRLLLTGAVLGDAGRYTCKAVVDSYTHSSPVRQMSIKQSMTHAVTYPSNTTGVVENTR